MTVKKVFGRKVGFGRFAAPLWALLVGGLMIAAAAGQAIGPVLSGSVTGQAGVTVSQTLLLSEQGSGGHVVEYYNLPGTEINEPYVITVNDEQTQFTAAIETVVGRALVLGLSIENLSTASNTDANGQLKLEVPAGMRVEVVGDNVLDGNLAQLNANTWLFTASGTETYSDGDSDILIAFKTMDNAAPGFYTIKGSIVQVTN